MNCKNCSEEIKDGCIYTSEECTNCATRELKGLHFYVNIWVWEELFRYILEEKKFVFDKVLRSPYNPEDE